MPFVYKSIKASKLHVGLYKCTYNIVGIVIAVHGTIENKQQNKADTTSWRTRVVLPIGYINVLPPKQ